MMNAWIQHKLGDFTSIVGGGTPSTSNPLYWNGSINWYSPTEIGDRNYTIDSQNKITEAGLSNSSARLLKPYKTILFTSRAGIGDTAILSSVGSTNQGFQSIVLDEKTDTYFLYSMTHLIKGYALKYASGSTFLEISGKTLAKMLVNLPSLSEQEKIGSLFLNLDNFITLTQRSQKSRKIIP